jgi:hypothetical protein
LKHGTYPINGKNGMPNYRFTVDFDGQEPTQVIMPAPHLDAAIVEAARTAFAMGRETMLAEKWSVKIKVSDEGGRSLFVYELGGSSHRLS